MLGNFTSAMSPVARVVAFFTNGVEKDMAPDGTDVSPNSSVLVQAVSARIAASAIYFDFFIVFIS